MWLLNKLFTHKDQPSPRFAFQGTVNWMRGLAILCDGRFSHQDLQYIYRNVQRRQLNEAADALAFEYLMMSMHNVDAIESMKKIEKPYSIVRSAIVAWYYATYYASKAMLAASSGADPHTHAATAKIWQSEIVDHKLLQFPFSLNLSNLTPANINNAIDALRNGNQYDLNTQPTNAEMAFGSICSYLKGTAEYEKWRIEEHIKESSEYKRGDLNSFRTKAAKALRDTKLEPAYVNFLTQSFRYRGKANYRDAIYLSYGRDQTDDLHQFILDLGLVSGAFSFMAEHYLFKRVAKEDWIAFAADVKQYSCFDLPYDLCEF